MHDGPTCIWRLGSASNRATFLTVCMCTGYGNQQQTAQQAVQQPQQQAQQQQSGYNPSQSPYAGAQQQFSSYKQPQGQPSAQQGPSDTYSNQGFGQQGGSGGYAGAQQQPAASGSGFNANIGGQQQAFGQNGSGRLSMYWLSSSAITSRVQVPNKSPSISCPDVLPIYRGCQIKYSDACCCYCNLQADMQRCSVRERLTRLLLGCRLGLSGRCRPIWCVQETRHVWPAAAAAATAAAAARWRSVWSRQPGCGAGA